ncbi:response regulator transcription factor [uncultured Dubosiella sp.]|uniref:response regulator transcription factor n=1 Tax=uncultured Dubosiella sp. TaxID=1937011 RepID=UPI002731F56B|nr:response regulator transcription factor [uncultured Dubosiella sp.]
METNNPKTVLIVEDDAQIAGFVQYACEQNGYRVLCASDGEQGLALFFSQWPDLILLDLGLPDMDGLQVLEGVRAASSVPVLILSARDQEQEKVKALDAGADDYLTKPFSVSELLARLRVALRHAQPDGRKIYRAGDLRVDPSRHDIELEGRPIHLTPLEYKLLLVLFENQGSLMTTQSIIKAVYGPYYGTDTRALRTLMASLRRKIEKNPAKPEYIFTEIGIGYRLRGE